MTAPWDRCYRDHTPTDEDYAAVYKTLPPDAGEDELHAAAVAYVEQRCADEPCGAGADPFGRTEQDWARHAE